MDHLSKYGEVTIYTEGCFELQLDICKLFICLPKGYPETNMPEIEVIKRSTKTWFGNKDLQDQIEHLWESSEHCDILEDVIQWIVNGQEETKCEKSDSKTIPPDPSRELVVYVWGNRVHKMKPPESQYNFDACCLNCRGPGIDLRKMNGTWPEMREKLLKDRHLYPRFLKEFINSVESNNYTVVSVNCAKGRHRSASFAETLFDYYPKLTVIHKTLNCVSTKDNRNTRRSNGR